MKGVHPTQGKRFHREFRRLSSAHQFGLVRYSGGRENEAKRVLERGISAGQVGRRQWPRGSIDRERREREFKFEREREECEEHDNPFHDTTYEGGCLVARINIDTISALRKGCCKFV
jgi:hypothetical protein